MFVKKKDFSICGKFKKGGEEKRRFCYEENKWRVVDRGVVAGICGVSRCK